jgi:hypothetical protein
VLLLAIHIYWIAITFISQCAKPNAAFHMPVPKALARIEVLHSHQPTPRAACVIVVIISPSLWFLNISSNYCSYDLYISSDCDPTPVQGGLQNSRSRSATLEFAARRLKRLASPAVDSDEMVGHWLIDIRGTPAAVSRHFYLDPGYKGFAALN